MKKIHIMAEGPEGRVSNIAQKTCELCNTDSSKYCCPRCNILYCSLDCYKSEKHAQCSEGFYRDCVNEELASYQTDNESKRKMVDILKKMQNENLTDGSFDDLIENLDDYDSDDEEHIDLHERVGNLNLNDADLVWEALTEDERNEFEAFLSQGEVGAIMPQWEPWWMYSKEKKLVEDVNEKEDDNEMLKKCPALKPVPEMSALTKVEPSPAIRYNITNVLASYAFIMRYFNGDLDAVEATVCLLDICSNLDANTNFDDLAVTVESVAQKCLQSNFIETDEFSLNVMKRDTFLILQGPSEENQKYYCKAALSHLHNVLTEAKTAAKKTKTTKDTTGFSRKFPDHKTVDLPNIDVSKVKKCIKKVEYYLSYVESCSMYFE